MLYRPSKAQIEKSVVNPVVMQHIEELESKIAHLQKLLDTEREVTENILARLYDNEVSEYLWTLPRFGGAFFCFYETSS